MTGARPNGRHTCVVRVMSSDRAGLRRVQRDFFVPASALSGPAPVVPSPAPALPIRAPARPAGAVCADRHGGRGARPGCRRAVHGYPEDVTPDGAIAHIKFDSCRKGVKSPLLKTDSVTPVTPHGCCQLRACHCEEADGAAEGHVVAGLTSPPGDARTGARRRPPGASGAPAGSSAAPAPREAATGSMASRSSRAQTAQCRVRWRWPDAAARCARSSARTSCRGGLARPRFASRWSSPVDAPIAPPPGGCAPPPLREIRGRPLVSEYSSADTAVKTRESPDPGDPGFLHCGPDGI